MEVGGGPSRAPATPKVHDLHDLHALFVGGRVTQFESECRSWRSAGDLLGEHPAAQVALVGAPLAAGSLTPGRCDLTPGVVRAALKRMSVYDLETETDLAALAV